MQFEPFNPTVAAIWLSAVCTAALAGQLSSMSRWAVLVAAALLPPLVMQWQRNTLRAAVCEAMPEALR
jgi:Flp pilus assembly protein TadB